MLAPLTGALLIALSRMADYRHDVYDVTCGALLGFTVTWFSYRRYFRRLRDAKCDIPYPSRAEYASKLESLRNGKKDLEEQRIREAEEFDLYDLTTSEEDEARPLRSKRDLARSPKGKGKVTGGS